MSYNQPEDPVAHGRAEDEPLLGRAGDASQQEGNAIQYNFFLGTAVIAQLGIWILAATIWASVFMSDVTLFSAHPLLNSAGILLTTQAILVLQPTHAPAQKKQGTTIHAILNGTSILTLLGGLIVIEYNKFAHNGAHFGTPHNVLGLLVYILFLLQALVGIAQYYIPALFGGVDNAKAVWKYHRASGYVILVLAFAAIATAAQTAFNQNVLHLQLWVLIVAAVITLVGLVPRIKKHKLGL